jgi:hypothetical protein
MVNANRLEFSDEIFGKSSRIRFYDIHNPTPGFKGLSNSQRSENTINTHNYNTIY